METVSLLAPRRAAVSRSTPVHLVAMPWPPIYAPYLALAALAAELRHRWPTRQVSEGHLYLRWYDRLLSTFGQRTSEIYSAVAEEGTYAQLGDMVFAIQDLTNAVLDDYVATVDLTSLTRSLLDDLRSLARDFVETEASRLVNDLPANAVLGLSSTFTQTMASLSLAAEVRAQRPDVRAVLGGSNMSGTRAEVILRQFSAIDFVVFGEGEDALGALLKGLDADADGPFDNRGIGYRRADGTIVVGPTGPFVDMSRLARPDPAGYFSELYGLSLDREIEPKLAYEIGRGCWWGEKRHCTFCGLNGEGMKFRRRNSALVADELLGLINEHEVLDVIFADNILHPDDVSNVFEQLPDSIDLRIHLEVKADLSRDQLLRLRNHGVWHVQPGIESLARRPLRLMRKGVTPMQNIRFLRSAEELGMTASWNILVGFPQEEYEDYLEMLHRMPLLHHLQPPGAVGKLALVRYSPLFEDAATFGLSDIRVRGGISLIYHGLDEGDVEVLAEGFDAGRGIGPHIAALVEELTDLTSTWRRSYARTYLYETVTDDSTITVRRRQDGVEELVATICEADEVALWEALRSGMSRHNLEEFVRREEASHEWLGRVLGEWRGRGVIYDDDGCCITLPTRYETHAAFRLLG